MMTWHLLKQPLRSCRGDDGRWHWLPAVLVVLGAIGLSACSYQPTREPTYVPAQQAGHRVSSGQSGSQVPSHRQQSEAPAPAAEMLIRQSDQALAAGQGQRALSQLERAQRISPRAPLVYLALARAHASLQQYDQAQQLVSRALSLVGDDQPMRARAWSLMASIRQQAGDTGGADVARRKAARY